MMNEFKRMVARVTVEIPLNRTFIDGGNGRKLPETPAKLLVNLSAPQATADPLTLAKLLVNLSAAMWKRLRAPAPKCASRTPKRTHPPGGGDEEGEGAIAGQYAAAHTHPHMGAGIPAAGGGGRHGSAAAATHPAGGLAMLLMASLAPMTCLSVPHLTGSKLTLTAVTPITALYAAGEVDMGFSPSLIYVLSIPCLTVEARRRRAGPGLLVRQWTGVHHLLQLQSGAWPLG